MHDGAGKVLRHPDTVNGVMWLELVAGGETTHVVNLDLVPSDSPRIHHNDAAQREFERIMACEGERRMVMGDWNARIGELSSYIFTGGEEEHGDMIALEESEYKRKSVDGIRNAAGRKILDIMNAQCMVVLNGLKSEMQHTQKGSIGWSVVDYIAVTPSMLHAEADTCVVEGSDVRVCSDHVMVMLSGVLRREAQRADAETPQRSGERKRWQRKAGKEGKVQWEEFKCAKWAKWKWKALSRNNAVTCKRCSMWTSSAHGPDTGCAP